MKTINVKSHGEAFHAGTTDSGSMVLMGLLPVRLPILGYFVPRLVLIWFEIDGAPSLIETKRVADESQALPEVSLRNDSKFREQFLLVLDSTMAEIGFVENTIVVQEFFDKQTEVGLNFRLNPNESVLSWGNHYTLDVDGKVVETG